MKTLKDLNVGQQAVVVRLHGEGPVAAAYHGYGPDEGYAGLPAQGWRRWACYNLSKRELDRTKRNPKSDTAKVAAYCKISQHRKGGPAMGIFANLP